MAASLSTRYTPFLWGIAASAALALFYVLVLGTLQGFASLGWQIERDTWWLAAIIGGFGTQAGLAASLRQRRKLASAARGTTSSAPFTLSPSTSFRINRVEVLGASPSAPLGASAGVSGFSMVACCAHHAADLLPFLGIATASAFLLEYRPIFLAVAVVSNAAGIVIAVLRLRQLARHESRAHCA